MIGRLEALTLRELEGLRNQARGRKCLLIVHPYFHTDRAKFEEFLRNKRVENYVVVIAEGQENQNELAESLGRLVANPKAIVLSYSTRAFNEPMPCIGWQKLLKKLELIGAKEIIAGGHTIDSFSLESEIAGLETTKKSQDNWHKDRARTARTMIRAAKNMHSNRTLGSCAGYTISKLAASGKFRVKPTRHFSR